METLWLSKMTLWFSLLVSYRLCDTKMYQKYSDYGLSVKQLIEKHRYPFENHTLITSDGYILELHRIPFGRNNTRYKTRPPILLVHGLMSNSAIWVNMGPTKSLGFILADEGYDVWLANNRGSTSSRKHIKYDPVKDKELFWNFSFQEIGYYDLAESIDYILHNTSQEKLFYLGHSHGTTTFFILASERPEYNDKLRMVVALAPVAYIGHSLSPFIRFFAIFKDVIKDYIIENEFYETGQYANFVTDLVERIYSNSSPLEDALKTVLELIMGYSNNELNTELLPMIAASALSAASVKQLYHYLQLYISKSFQQFDYGEEENQKRYGQPKPPQYDLHKITSPIALYYGTKDLFCVAEDVNKTVSELPNVIKLKLIEGFNHLDVIVGADTTELVVDDFLKLLHNY